MKIIAIQTGNVRVKKNQVSGRGKGQGRQLNILFGSEWIGPLPIYAWVIEHAEGVIIVDTGETARSSEAGYFPQWHPYYRLAVRFQVFPEQEIGPQLRQMGIQRKDVKKVILTHMHSDHAGGLHHFPESGIHLHMLEYRRSKGFRGKVDGYLPHRMPDWLSPIPIEFGDDGLGSFDKSWNVTKRGDVKVVPTPGHTPAHVSVIVKTEDVYYFLAGDTSYSERNLLDKIADGVSPDPDQAISTMQNILNFAKQFPTIYLPTHDLDSEVRLKSQRTLQRQT